MKKVALFLFSLFFANNQALAKDKDVSINYNYLMSFIENKGQIIDQNYKPNPSVKYIWNGGGIKVQLKDNSFSYEIIKKTNHVEKRNSNNFSNIIGFKQNKRDSIVFSSHRIDVELIGAKHNPIIVTEEKSTDYDNYYTTGTPEEGVTFVYHYGKVAYKDIYPNIDLEFVTDTKNEKGFKYNFIVRPGGNIENIQLQYKGTSNIQLKQDGRLVLNTSNGVLEENIPLSYEMNTGNSVQVKYKQIDKNIYGLLATQYNPLQTLIIDPWATFYGGNNYDAAWGSCSDNAGNLFVCGDTYSNNNIATSGVYQTTINSGGDDDGFIVKFNQLGLRQWGTYYGGSGGDNFISIKLDDTLNIISSGQSYSSTGIATIGSFQQIAGADNGMIVKFNNLGIRVWGTYFGDSTAAGMSSLYLDNSNNIYLSGCVYGSISANFCTSGAFQSVYGGGLSDAFLSKYNSSGYRVWTTIYGGNNQLPISPNASWQDMSYGIIVDDTGNVYMTGSTQSINNIASSNAFQSTYGGGNNLQSDAFLVKFNSSGSRLWGTYFGGSADDGGFSVSFDNIGNIIVGGVTNSSTNIATSNTYQPNIGGNYDGFIAKFSPLGNRIWSTYYGGNGNDACNATIDNNNNIIILGRTNSTNNIASVGCYQPYIGGSDDAFLAKLNSNATNRYWGTYFGGSNDEFVYGEYRMAHVHTDSLGNIIFIGSTLSNNNIATTNAHQTIYGGNEDAFIAVFDNNGTLTPTPAITGNSANTAQAVCSNVQPALLTGNSPSGGNGTFGYLWLQSTTSATSGFIAASGSNNTQNYQPSLLSVTTWYKRVVMSGNAVDTSAAVQITVNAAPVANITAGGATAFCQGASVTLNANTGAGFNYQWYDGATLITNATNSNYSAATGGSYTVLISNSNNCTDTSNAITVTVNPVPTASIAAGGNTTICNGEGVNLNAQTATGYTYQWYNGNSIITGATNATYLANTSGSYTVLVDLGSCSDTSNAIVVTVNALPSVIITQTVDTFYSNGSFNTYQWYLNGTAIAGATNPNYTATQNGNYYVMVTDANNCSGQSNTILFTVGIDEVDGGHLFSVSPNPFKESFVVKCPTAKGTIIVSDLIGKTLVRLSLSKPQTTIDMKGYSSEVYFVKYDDGEVCETVKVVKE